MEHLVSIQRSEPIILESTAKFRGREGELEGCGNHMKQDKLVEPLYSAGHTRIFHILVFPGLVRF